MSGERSPLADPNKFSFRALDRARSRQQKAETAVVRSAERIVCKEARRLRRGKSS